MDTYGRFSIPKFAIFYMPRNHKFGIQWYSTLLSLIGRIELECELLLQTNRNWTKYSNIQIAKVFLYCLVFVCKCLVYNFICIQLGIVIIECNLIIILTKETHSLTIFVLTTYQTDHLLFLCSDDIIRLLEQNG